MEETMSNNLSAIVSQFELHNTLFRNAVEDTENDSSAQLYLRLRLPYPTPLC